MFSFIGLILLMGLVTILCVIFLAYGQGATTYGFINLPLRTFGFMRFQARVLESFGPMDFIQPVMGLANFDRAGFEVAMNPLVSILMSYQFYVEVALWTVACYLSGRIAHKWKGPYLPKEIPNDPWDNPYVYKCPGEHGEYDLISYGLDKTEGGEGENQDVVSWKN
jgi:hypothetical protein